MLSNTKMVVIYNNNFIKRNLTIDDYNVALFFAIEKRYCWIEYTYTKRPVDSRL